MTLSAEEMETESQMLGLDSLRETKAAQLVSSSEGSKGDCISVGSLLSREEFNRGRRQGSPPLGQQTLRTLASDCDTCKQQPGSTHPLNQLAAGFLPSKQKKKVRDTDLIESPTGMKVRITELLVEKVPQGMVHCAS